MQCPQCKKKGFQKLYYLVSGCDNWSEACKSCLLKACEIPPAELLDLKVEME